MPASYSNDLRWKVIGAYEDGESSASALAGRFKVSQECISDLLCRYAETGDVSPEPHNGGRRAEIRGPKEKYIRCLIKAEPELLLEEIQDRYYRAWSVFISISALSNSLRRLRITRKKNNSATRKNTRNV